MLSHQHEITKIHDVKSDFDLQPTLAGKLLRLQPLRESDFDELFRAASDPLIWEQHPASDRCKEPVFRQFFKDAMDSRGALVVVDAKTGEIIGSSRYYELAPDLRDVVIGYTFLTRKYWGGDYNREMKRLMLSHVFKYVPTVLFHVDENNRRSQKAMEKIGGRRVAQLQRPLPNGGTRAQFVYGIDRATCRLTA